MNGSPVSVSGTPRIARRMGAPVARNGAWLLLLAATGIPVSLLWDFSWESTVGIDLFWAAAHTATYASVALTGLTTLGLVFTTTRVGRAQTGAVRLGPFHAPLGAWLALWGALAFPTAVMFDRWWQSAYGLAAGIWHPPQILKAIAFFAVVIGAWLLCLRWQNELAGEKSACGAVLFAGAGGLVLAMITVVTLTSIYPNRQHSASFYKLACGSYPFVLAALATAGKLRWPATVASIVYGAVICSMVWLLPLFAAKPQVAPIYNPLDHLMPPPFPLLLIVPAVAVDALLRSVPWPIHRGKPWFQAGAVGLAFFILFFCAQWAFADFLLSDAADNWFFAGGGRHWPFFLKIDPLARVMFWDVPQDEMNFVNTLAAAALAVFAARVGLWVGAWMTRVRR